MRWPTTRPATSRPGAATTRPRSATISTRSRSTPRPRVPNIRTSPIPRKTWARPWREPATIRVRSQRYQRALALREKALGPVHVDVASSLLDVAASNRGLRDYAAAEATLRRSVEVYSATSGKDNPRTATALLGLGEILALQGRPAEAR